jgi:hypothetical protein
MRWNAKGMLGMCDDNAKFQEWLRHLERLVFSQVGIPNHMVFISSGTSKGPPKPRPPWSKFHGKCIGCGKAECDGKCGPRKDKAA